MLLNRKMKTLGMCMEAHNKNAETLVAYLSQQSKVSRMWCPTLKGHPGHAVATRLMPAFGCVISSKLMSLKVNGYPWGQNVS